MSHNPYSSAVVGAWDVMVHSSYSGWILLCDAALTTACIIAFRDDSRVRQAEKFAAIERLRR